MCTVQLLLQTNAHVIAFEPNPINQYHLTRTLLSLARLHPSIVGRVVVYPCGIGEVESRVGAIRMDPMNLGSSEISGHRRAATNQRATQSRDRTATDPVAALISQGKANTVAMGSPAASRRATAVARAPQQSLPPPPPPHLEGAGSSTGRSTANTTVGSAGQILIKPLIDILPQMDSLDVALMKVDVQGMECQVLAGARSLLHRMRIVTAEVTPHLLTLQECSVEDLRTSLLLDPPWQARAIAYLPDAHYRDATFVSMECDPAAPPSIRSSARECPAASNVANAIQRERGKRQMKAGRPGLNQRKSNVSAG